MDIDHVMVRIVLGMIMDLCRKFHGILWDYFIAATMGIFLSYYHEGINWIYVISSQLDMSHGQYSLYG